MTEINDILAGMDSYLAKPDKTLVEKAFKFAEECHREQKRASGEPYIVHPVGVAKILTEMKMDSVTIAAGLLHDVVEDCDVTVEDINKRFGNHVALLVSGVTKLSHFSFENRRDASLENFRRMFLIMAEHVRVVFIKLADRLYNMRTLEHLKPKDQKRIAKETMDIYAPLAERLGMGQIKGELADLSFKYLEPKEYEKMMKVISAGVKERDKNIQQLIDLLAEKLPADRVNVANIEGRAKHIYSTFKKLARVGDISKVYDLLAIRVIVESVADCYKTLGVIHGIFKPLAGNFKDYIAVPKPNGYRSLHTTIFGIGGEITEVQIRTSEMHEEAEEGLAAHWYYAEVKQENSKRYTEQREQITTPKERLSWVKALSDWQKNISLPEFEEHLKVDLFKDRILVLSPKGDLYDLPADSTPIDFSFAVHSELGYRVTGAKVNGRIVTLDHHLSNRDVVELLTTKVAKGPSRDWLNFVKTSHAKHQIRSWFKRQNRGQNMEWGKKLIEEELVRFAGSEAMKPKTYEEIAREFNVDTPDELFVAVGEGIVTTGQVIRALLRGQLEKQSKKRSAPGRSASGILVLGASGITVKTANCCNPKTGDSIIGYTTRGKGITAHSLNCKNVAKLEKDRIVSVAWDLGQTLLVPVRLIGKNRVGLLRDVSSQISGMGVNITNVATRTRLDNSSEISLTLEIDDSGHLVDIFRKLKLVPDINEIERI